MYKEESSKRIKPSWITITLGIIQFVSIIVLVLVFFLRQDLNAETGLEVAKEVRQNVAVIEKNVSDVCLEVTDIQKTVSLHDMRLTAIEESNKSFVGAINKFSEVVQKLDKNVAVLSEQVKNLKDK